MDIFPAEVIGTAIPILLGDGVVAAVLLAQSKAQNSGWIVITWGWGMAVMVAVFAVGQFSGAHLNPAVTLGTAVIGDTEWSDVPAYLGGEFVGAMIGAFLVWAAYSNHWKATEDPGLKLAVFCTAPGDPQHGRELHHRDHRDVRPGVRRPGDLRRRGDRGAGLGAFFVGLLVLAIGLSLGGPTGYAINPARDLGPRIMHAILPIPGKARRTGATRGSR